MTIKTTARQPATPVGRCSEKLLLPKPRNKQRRCVSRPVSTPRRNRLQTRQSVHVAPLRARAAASTRRHPPANKPLNWIIYRIFSFFSETPSLFIHPINDQLPIGYQTHTHTNNPEPSASHTTSALVLYFRLKGDSHRR